MCIRDRRERRHDLEVLRGPEAVEEHDGHGHHEEPNLHHRNRNQAPQQYAITSCRFLYRPPTHDAARTSFQAAAYSSWLAGASMSRILSAISGWSIRLSLIHISEPTRLL